MAPAPEIAIDLSRRRLRAVHADSSRGRLRIRATLAEPWPESLDADDAAAVGAWLGRRLHQAGLPADRAAIALPRESVALKRLTLPTIDAVELPDMTRLAMQRELPFDPATAVIDYVPLRHSEASTTVLAVAVPRDVIAHTQKIAKAAGLGIESVSLRSIGVAALVGAMHPAFEQRERRILVIDVTGNAVEFNVIEDGAIRFSRAAEIAPGPSDGGDDQAVIREVRRTWMSYRIVDDDSRIDAALLLADDRMSAKAIASLGDMLHVRAELLDHHPCVDLDHAGMNGLWPLAGLLLAPVVDAQSIDFTHPRMPPDVGARKRQLAIAAAGILAIALFGGWTWARRTLAPLETRLAELQDASRKLAPQYQRYGRDLYKLEHLQRWDTTRVDWLEHAAALQDLALPPGQMVLDEWTGTLNVRGIDYDAKTNVWSAPHEITIVLDGEAIDRRAADAFRAALVDSNLYNARSGGTDAQGGKRLPFGFSYRLSTQLTSPPQAPAPGKSTPDASTPKASTASAGAADAMTAARDDAPEPGEPEAGG